VIIKIWGGSRKLCSRLLDEILSKNCFKLHAKRRGSRKQCLKYASIKDFEDILPHPAGVRGLKHGDPNEVSIRVHARAAPRRGAWIETWGW